jgi:hypothetical protein
MNKYIIAAIFTLIGLVLGVIISLNLFVYPNDREQILETINIHIDPMADGIHVEYIEEINNKIHANVSNANCYLIFSGGPKLIVVGDSRNDISVNQINATASIVSEMLIYFEAVDKK